MSIAARTQMITAQEVIDICIAQKNFSKDKLKDSLIEAAEQEYIRPFLGEDLYAQIRTQYKAGTLTALNETLLVDYLKFALCYFVLHKALPFIMMDITTLGVMINNSEFATSGTDKQRADLTTEALNNANIFLNKTKLYLEDTAISPSYPLYLSGNNIQSEERIIGGVVLDIDDSTHRIDNEGNYHKHT